MPLAETTFDVTYDGPALAAGRMPVRDLAPALLALGDLFALSGRKLYPELEPIAVKVEATAEGSFSVRLFVDAHDAWDQLVQVFGSKEASALTNLRDALLSTAGVFWLIKSIGRRRVAKTDAAPEPGKIVLTLDDQTTLEIPSDTWKLYRSVEVRKYTHAIVEPLARKGVELVTFTADEAAQVVVEKADLPVFALIEGEEEKPLLEAMQEMYVEVVAPAFRDDNKWRLGIGGDTFWARIEDEEFWARVESGDERFGKGDLLRCSVEITQTLDAEGLHTDYRVVHVLEHIPRERHLQLTLGGEDVA